VCEVLLFFSGLTPHLLLSPLRPLHFSSSEFRCMEASLHGNLSKRSGDHCWLWTRDLFSSQRLYS